MKKSVSVLMAGTMLFSAASLSVPMSWVSNAQDNNSQDNTEESISGRNRYETSLKVSRKTFEKADTAVIVSGENFPDALSSGVFAAKMKAPVILSKGDKLSDGINGELERLGVKKIYIFGGKSMISDKVENELKEKYKVERIAGKDRYETSLLVLKELRKTGAVSDDEIAIASGETFPDALTASSAMAKENIPLVLVKNGNMKNIGNSKVKYIIGGKSSISEDIPGAKRIAGKDRYETSIKIADEFFKGFKKGVLVSGEVFSDALTSSTYSYVNDYPVFLIKRYKRVDSIYNYLKEKDAQQVLIGYDIFLKDGTSFNGEVQPSVKTPSSNDLSGGAVSSGRHSSGRYSSNSSSNDKKDGMSLNDLKKIAKDTSDLIDKMKNDENADGIIGKDELVAESGDAAAKLNEIQQKMNDFLAKESYSEEDMNNMEKMIGHHGVIGSELILKPYTIEDAGNSKLVKDAVKSLSSDKKDESDVNQYKQVRTFPRISRSDDGSYEFKIVSNHKGFKFNGDSSFSKDKDNKMIAFTYVTKDGYKNLDPKKVKPEDVEKLKVHDTVLNESNVQIDTVTSPTPRYKRASILGLVKDSGADITVREDKSAPGTYVVRIANLPENVVIVKPVFIADLPGKNGVEYGDMVFIDIANHNAAQHSENQASDSHNAVQPSEHQN